MFSVSAPSVHRSAPMLRRVHSTEIQHSWHKEQSKKTSITSYRGRCETLWGKVYLFALPNFAAIEGMSSLSRPEVSPMYDRDEVQTLRLNFIASYAARLTQLTALLMCAVINPMSALQHLASLISRQSLEMSYLDFSQPFASPNDLSFIFCLSNLMELSIVQAINQQPQMGPPLQICGSFLRSLVQPERL